MTDRDPSATGSWADRLLEAMEADKPFGDAQPGTTLDDPPRSVDGPWQMPPEAVPDHVVVAAMIGHPSQSDAERILDDPAALERLRRHWSATPPDPGLLNSAAANPALARLLTAAGSSLPVGGLPGPVRRRQASSRRGYRLAAASSESARTAKFPGGRLTTQRLLSGSVSLTVEFDGGLGADLRKTQSVAWVTGVDASPELHVLVILVRSSSGDGTSLVGRVEVPAGTGLDKVEVSTPIPVKSLWSAGSPDFDVVTDSVAWAPFAWKEAWRQTALQVGEAHPFSRAVERGLSLR